jgi:hypothetical protein
MSRESLSDKGSAPAICAHDMPYKATHATAGPTGSFIECKRENCEAFARIAAF